MVRRGTLVILRNAEFLQHGNDSVILFFDCGCAQRLQVCCIGINIATCLDNRIQGLRGAFGTNAWKKIVQAEVFG